MAKLECGGKGEGNVGGCTIFDGSRAGSCMGKERKGKVKLNMVDT